MGYRKHRFKQVEQVTVWRAYDGRCYWCHEPVELRHLTIDHVFPEKLLDTPDELDAIKKQYSLSPDWSINGYANWVPAHASCNGKKGTITIRPSPAFLLELEKIQKTAKKCAKIERQWLRKSDSDQILASIMTALETNNLSPAILRKIADQWPVVKGIGNTFAPLLLGERAGIIEGPTSNLLKFVSFETKTLDVVSPYIDSVYIEKLRRIAAQSICVRVLISDALLIQTSISERTSLIESMKYIDFRVIRNLHEKMMIVDGETLVLTSANFTAASMTKNLEHALFTSAPDQVGSAVDNFGSAWAEAISVEEMCRAL
jgi:phosphatidylserine/phosphatidylglycerophosphate/cardiolipin synthase-like enzyme